MWKYCTVLAASPCISAHALAPPVVDGRLIGPGDDIGEYTLLATDGAGTEPYFAVDGITLYVAVKT